MGIYLPQEPAITFLGIHPKEVSSYHRDICTAIFIAALWCCLRKAPSYENCRMSLECSRHEMEVITGTLWVAQNLRLEIPRVRVKLNIIVLKISYNKMTSNVTSIDQHLTQPSSEKLEIRNNLDVPQQKKMWYIYMWSVTWPSKNEIMKFAAKWIKLEKLFLVRWSSPRNTSMVSIHLYVDISC